MPDIYLWGAVLMTAAAVVYAGGMRAPAFLAGLLWPVVVVGMVQMLIIHLLTKVIQASGEPTYAGAVAMADTRDTDTPVLVKSRS